MSGTTRTAFSLAFFAICLLLGGTASAQVGYVWAKGIQGPGWYDFGLDATCDAQGRVFICGDYEGPTLFDGVNYNGIGSSDMYTCRLDPTGYFEWVSVDGTIDTERNFSVALGPNGSVFTCGYGKIPYPGARLSALHQWDAITVKLYPNGSFAWGRAMLGDIYSESYDVVPAPDGSSYTVGQLRTVGWYGNDTLYGHGGRDAFIVKFDSSGNYLWGKTFGGNLTDLAASVDLDAQGNVWVGGAFEASSFFGTTNVLSTGLSDGYVAKLDPNGNVLFVKPFTGPNVAEVVEIAVSDDGDCYFTGNFSGSLTLGTQTVTNTDSLDVFYGKMDASGNVVWARALGGSDLDIVQDMELDAQENVYLGGFYYGSIDWQGQTGQSEGFDDLWFGKTDSTGLLTFMEVSGDPYSRDVFGVAVDPAQNMILTGSFTDTIFAGSDTLIGPGFNTEIFVLKYATRTQSMHITAVIGSPYCVNDHFDVAFEAFGNFEAGNVFSLELSDANGSFASPVVIGSVQGQFGDTIAGTIPPGIVPGTQYRLRLTASLPSVTSADNGFDITLDPNTSIPVVISGDTVICNGQPVTLSIPGGFVHQVWSNGDTTTSTVVATPGIISVEATDSNGCTNQDQVEVTLCIGNQPQLSEPRLTLSPNPASGQVWLSMQGVSPGTYALRLLDAQGRLVQAREIAVLGRQLRTSVDLSGLSAGVYAITLHGLDRQFHSLLQVQ